MGFTGGDYIVIGLILLQHQPHCLDVFLCVTPIALRIQISQIEFFLQPGLDAHSSASNLSRNKCFATPRALVVEKNSAGGEQVVRLAIINSHPMRVYLCRPIRAARIKWRGLSLRHFLNFSKHLGATSLIKLGFDSRLTNCFQNSSSAQGRYIARIFRNIKAHAHVALRRQMVDLVGLDAIEKFNKIGRISDIAIMKKQTHAIDMWISVEVIYSTGIKSRGAAN